MSTTTLYQKLGMPARGRDADRGRTERTADDRETIDDDHMVIDLYAILGDPVVGDSFDVGRTEETKSTGETIDKDRAGEALATSLLEPSTDLYAALVSPARSVAADWGETAITASTETIDYDQPPDFRHT
jgi:hypothetical protein